MYYLTESATVTVVSNDGQFSFEENSKAIFTCTIDPYGGTLNWCYDETRTAGCIGSACSDVYTDSGAFQYQYNITATVGIFTWTISSVQNKYNGKIFRCHDGSKSEAFTVTVTSTVKSKK